MDTQESTPEKGHSNIKWQLDGNLPSLAPLSILCLPQQVPTTLAGSYQPAIFQLPLQQAVQGEGDDVVQVLHLENPARQGRVTKRLVAGSPASNCTT